MHWVCCLLIIIANLLYSQLCCLLNKFYAYVLTYGCVYVSKLYTWITYTSILLHIAILKIILIHTIAFSQPATGPSRICEGSDVTLQCRVVFNDSPRDSVWFRNGTAVRVGNDFIPNHNQIFNSTTGARTDLVITNVTLEDDNTVYTCNSTDDSITSSEVLNVLGKYVCVKYQTACHRAEQVCNH